MTDAPRSALLDDEQLTRLLALAERDPAARAILESIIQMALDLCAEHNLPLPPALAARRAAERTEISARFGGSTIIGRTAGSARRDDAPAPNPEEQGAPPGVTIH